MFGTLRAKFISNLKHIKKYDLVVSFPCAQKGYLVVTFAIWPLAIAKSNWMILKNAQIIYEVVGC